MEIDLTRDFSLTQTQQEMPGVASWFSVWVWVLLFTVLFWKKSCLWMISCRFNCLTWLASPVSCYPPLTCVFKCVLLLSAHLSLFVRLTSPIVFLAYSALLVWMFWIYIFAAPSWICLPILNSCLPFPCYKPVYLFIVILKSLKCTCCAFVSASGCNP